MYVFNAADDTPGMLKGNQKENSRSDTLMMITRIKDFKEDATLFMLWLSCLPTILPFDVDSSLTSVHKRSIWETFALD
jgi:hypothetical protein